MCKIETFLQPKNITTNKTSYYGDRFQNAIAESWQIKGSKTGRVQIPPFDTNT